MLPNFLILLLHPIVFSLFLKKSLDRRDILVILGLSREQLCCFDASVKSLLARCNFKIQLRLISKSSYRQDLENNKWILREGYTR